MTQVFTERPATRVTNQIHLFTTKRGLQSQLQVSVVVPVRNEAINLPDTLDALRNQVDAEGKLLPAGSYEVLLLANNCTDQSANIALDYQKRFPEFLLHIEAIQLPLATANIGTVRRLLMDAAYLRLKQSSYTNGIIASTDGDTVVDNQWVYNIIKEIEKGNDAVGGRILTKKSDSPVRLYHLRDVMYRSLLAKAEAILDPSLHDPWPRHFQYFGASLAVTCSMYERAGRLPQVPYLEDNAFYKALTRIDAKVRKSNQVKVYTSARMAGRVAVGFSEQLQKWNCLASQSAVQLVEPADAWLIKFKNRHALRSCRNEYIQTGHCNRKLISIAQTLFINPLWLKRQLENSLFFGELWHLVEQEMNTGKWSRHWKPMAITDAIDALRSFVETPYLASQ